MHKKKSLGQHFLRSKSYLNAVVDAAEITQGETVVEIGPGEGTLTEQLLAARAKVLAIEKDHRLISFLEKKFAAEIENGKLKLIEGDAKDYDISKSFGVYVKGALSHYKVVGNIPYYITGALLRKFLEAPHQPSTLVFLLQKEVAERIVGNPEQRRGTRPKKESLLSLSVKAYGIPHYIKSVPAGAFSPPPKVDSAILAVRNISRKNFESRGHEERFFDALKRGFGQKRKLLKNNLGERYKRAFETLRLPDKARAEDIALEQWLKLTKETL